MYHRKLLQRSGTRLSSWPWTPAAGSSLHAREATAGVGPPSASGLRARRPRTTGPTPRSTRATRCGALSAPGTRRVPTPGPFFPPRPEGLKPPPGRLGRPECAATPGRPCVERSPLCRRVLVVWNCTDSVIPEQINQLP